jgi:hypothetical protein
MLPDCPWMPRRCPHMRADCNDPASRSCHYVQNTIGTAISVKASLSQLEISSDYPALQQYLKELDHLLEATNYGQ